MFFLRENIKFLYVLLLPVILFTGIQILQNKHAHFCNNEIVVHSHPFEKENDAPINNHNHTKAEIFFYNLVNFEYFSPSGEQLFETGIFLIPKIYKTTEEQSPYCVWLYDTDTRDPPAGSC